MSSWAACKNIYTDSVLQKSSTPISTQMSEDLWDWTNVHCCVKRDEHRYGYITQLLCALCQIYRGEGRRWRQVQRHTDGRGRDRDRDRDTGTEMLSMAGKRVFFEGARYRDNLGLEWKRNVESFYPLLRDFYQPGPGHVRRDDVDTRAAPVENIPLGKILDETKWLHTLSASASECHLNGPDTPLELILHQI